MRVAVPRVRQRCTPGLGHHVPLRGSLGLQVVPRNGIPSALHPSSCSLSLAFLRLSEINRQLRAEYLINSWESSALSSVEYIVYGFGLRSGCIYNSWQPWFESRALL